jgi:hypothetical protein
MWMKYPIAVGDRFKTEHGDYADTHLCVSTDTLLTSPVARFRSILIRMNPDGNWHTDIFYRPGLGIVGEVGISPSGSKTIVSKRWLVSYTIH